MSGEARGAAGKGSASDLFLHIEGRGGAIKGESSTQGHVGDIEVRTWHWGVAAASAIGSGTSTARRSYRHFVITKSLDSASTPLMSSLVTNAELRQVDLTMRKAGGEAIDYFKVELKGARVVDVDVEVDLSGVPVERVTFSFTRVTATYTPQGNAGSGAGSTMFEDEVLPA
jgi:type VI secretion system secreted protein Hcp